MGKNPGQGRGGFAQEEQTRSGFIKHREKVFTGRGAIIGQYLVDGEQLKGEVSRSAKEIIEAGDSEATDAIDRARIPRAYHKSVKGYFSDLQDELDSASKRSPRNESDDSKTPQKVESDDKE
jgi:hypothetical protein